MRNLSILWLVEHVARELDSACAAASLLRTRHGLDVEIWHMYRDAPKVLHEVLPNVVIHPFFYFAKGALATQDFVACWPDASHFNLAWEQIHYPAHQKAKAPADQFTKETVLHHAWGEFYRDYLLQHGVPNEHILVNGNPAYALYSEPYRSFFKSRQQLAQIYGLDPSKKWIFVPENYRWAFVTDKRISTFGRWGGDSDEATQLRTFSLESLAKVLQWCASVAENDAFEVIFRTRPSTSAEQMGAFAESVLGASAARLYYIKGESVREWILASDVTISSYSTSLIEASLANKPCYMVEPLPIPTGLHCDWYDLVPSLTTASEFERACLEPAGPPAELAGWARREMLSSGDPIARLADHLANLAREQQLGANRQAERAASAKRTASALPERNYFNPSSHDQDTFDQASVETRIRAWSRTLDGGKEMKIINKTMDRADLLTAEGERESAAINELINSLYRRGLSPSSWVGTVPKWKTGSAKPEMIREPLERLGLDQRRDYEPLPGAVDDPRFPWFLYWEIFWVLHVTRPFLGPGARLLDAGGASSVFSCYLASLGFNVATVDLNEKLIANNNLIAEQMGWSSRAVAMNLMNLDYPDESFDHVYSICVFEHLDYPIKQAAIKEIARCLKPGGFFSLTFDYRNPAPGVLGVGKDPRPINQISSPADLERTFMTDPRLEVYGNPDFRDSGVSYLSHPLYNYSPYTFGSLFLRKK